MAKGEDSHLEIAHVRQSDGINVVFDQNLPASSRSRSRSKSGGSGRHRGRNNRKVAHRHSSSRSRSRAHPRSRSHPRCHRPSSRCRCDKHRGSGGGCRSPARRHRAHSGSPSPTRHSPNRRNKPHSRATSRQSRQSKAVSRSSQSPPRNDGNSSSSRSGSSEHSVNLSFEDKVTLIDAAEAIATTIPGVEKLELPENVIPILSEQVVETKLVLTGTWVRQDLEKTTSQSNDDESDDVFSRGMSPKRKTISFSINNSVLKQTGVAPSGAKVTSRVDIYESRKPYGHWMPVKSGHASSARKRALAMSH